MEKLFSRKIWMFLVVFSYYTNTSSAFNCFYHSERYGGIAILAWGSLVKSPRNLEFEGKFKQTNITFPIELSCVSFEGTGRQKLTRIVDKHWGRPMTLWCANAKNHFLPKAIDNLAQRETTSIDKIFYIRTLQFHELHQLSEVLVLDKDIPLKNNDGKLWCIGLTAFQQLPRSKVIELTKWATIENYDAALWTGLEMTPGYGRSGLLKLLQRDPRTLENTQKYILNSPDMDELTQFEQNILNGDI